MAAYLNKDGVRSTSNHDLKLGSSQDSILIRSDGDVVRQDNSGYLFDFGFHQAPANTYQHFKWNITKYNIMVRFKYEGFSYSSNGPVLSQMTVYTYTGSGGPYDPRYHKYGYSTSLGWNNCYYSSDGYLVTVLYTGHTSGYTGGWLWASNGVNFSQSNIDLLAKTSTSSNSGAY